MHILAFLLLALPLAIAAPANPGDTDGDGLSDAVEDANGNTIMDGSETDRMNADSDHGGEADGAEMKAGRNPLMKEDDFTWDKDGDGLTNGEESEKRTNPSRVDTDGDGINDRDDPFPLDARYKADSDADKIPDEYEALHTQNTALNDGAEDADGDTLSNLEEFQKQTDPNNADTDLDGKTDIQELTEETDPTVAPCITTADPSPPPFPDAVDHWAQSHIELLHSTRTSSEGSAIVDGYLFKGKRYFLPDREISRFELLKITLMSTCVPWISEGSLPARTFSDVPALVPVDASEDMRHKNRVIYTGLSRGIVEGYDEGDFRPDIVVNRAEAMAMLLRATGNDVSGTEPTSLSFSDVPEDAWYRSALSLAVSEGIIQGYADNTFRAGNAITRAEAAKIVALLMQRNASVRE